MSIVAKEQIQGWKEIAAYLGRDERTAKRWEKQRGLPVRRIPGSGRANVYILVADLEAWLQDDPSAVASDLSASDPESSDADPHGANAALESDTVPAYQSSSWENISSLPSEQARLSGFGIGFLSLFALVLVAATAYAIHLRRAPRTTLATASPAKARSLYRSPKSGVDDLYLQGAYFLEERTPASLEAARKAFDAALLLDPNDAPAYAGLANTYILLREFSNLPSDEAYRRAADAARRALALDPSLPEAHAALGYIEFFSEWKAESAAQHFQAALHADPNCVLALHGYGSMLTHQGRYPEALDALNAARRLEPSSSAILASQAFALGLSGKRDEAIQSLESILRTDPNMPAPHRILFHLAVMSPRDIPLYLEQLRKFNEIRQNNHALEGLGPAAEAFRREGERAMWQSLLDYERSKHPDATHPSYIMAEVEVQLGFNEKAIHDLDLLYTQRESLLMNLVTDALFDPIRADPRFRAIETQIGLIHQTPGGR